MSERLFHWLHRLFPYRVVPNPYGGWEHELRPCMAELTRLREDIEEQHVLREVNLKLWKDEEAKNARLREENEDLNGQVVGLLEQLAKLREERDAAVDALMRAVSDKYRAALDELGDR